MKEFLEIGDHSPEPVWNLPLVTMQRTQANSASN
jgi:hypothetical protein